MQFLKNMFAAFFHMFRSQPIQKDYLLDPKYLKERAKNGDLSAQFLVGYAMTEGRFGFLINSEEGKEWLNLVGKNLFEPPGYSATAHFYLRFGLFKKALLYLTHAKRDSYVPSQYLWAETKYRISLLEEQQNDKPNRKNRREIIKIIKGCSRQGFVPAITFLGERYLDGWGVTVNPLKALNLLLKAASKGDCPAKIILGKIYQNGVPGNIKQSTEESRKWYESAEKQGFLEAVIALKKLDAVGQVIAWPLEDVEKMIRIFIHRGNKKHRGNEWKLIKESNNVLIVSENGEIPLFTLTGVEKNQNVTIKFNHTATLSKRAAMFTLLICASPVVIDSSSLENMKTLLEEVMELNKILKDDKKIVVEFSERTLAEFKGKQEALSTYPIVQEAINQQINSARLDNSTKTG